MWGSQRCFLGSSDSLVRILLLQLVVLEIGGVVKGVFMSLVMFNPFAAVVILPNLSSAVKTVCMETQEGKEEERKVILSLLVFSQQYKTISSSRSNV